MDSGGSAETEDESESESDHEIEVNDDESLFITALSEGITMHMKTSWSSTSSKCSAGCANVSRAANFARQHVNVVHAPIEGSRIQVYNKFIYICNARYIIIM